MHAEVLRAIVPDETAKQRKRFFFPPTLRIGIFFLPRLALGGLTCKVFQMALSLLSPLLFPTLMLRKTPKCIPLPSTDSSPELFTHTYLKSKGLLALNMPTTGPLFPPQHRIDLLPHSLPLPAIGIPVLPASPSETPGVISKSFLHTGAGNAIGSAYKTRPASDLFHPISTPTTLVQFLPRITAIFLLWTECLCPCKIRMLVS